MTLEEVKIFHAIVNTVTKTAHDSLCHLYVDAEQTYMQKAIDAVARMMQERYHKEWSFIMNGFQCYLKETPGLIEKEIKRC